MLFTTRLEPTLREVVDHYDDRAGRAADRKSAKRGRGVALLRKHKPAARQMGIRLAALAPDRLRVVPALARRTGAPFGRLWQRTAD